MLLRIHLACCISLRRHSAWLHSLLIAFEAQSLFGACAAYRGFLESAADSLYSLRAAPTMLASNLTAIVHRLERRRTDTIIASKDLEDRLIHFTHGRKLERGESADPVHAARQIREYLDSLKAVGVPDAHALYAELCSLTHPAAESDLVRRSQEGRCGDLAPKRHTPWRTDNRIAQALAKHQCRRDECRLCPSVHVPACSSQGRFSAKDSDLEVLSAEQLSKLETNRARDP